MRARLALAAAAVGAAAALAACTTGGPAPGPAPTPEPSPTPAGPTRVLFLGDSYTEGTGLFTEDAQARWPTVMSAANGWVEINAGCNGSGYVRTGAICLDTYAERIPSLADTDPDIVIVSGGVNDLGYPIELIEAGIDQTLDLLVETFPEARIYAVNGIYYTGSRTPPEMVALNEALREAADRTGVTYLDIGDPLLGRPELMAYDYVHPNPEGHALIARLTQEAIDAAG